MLNSCAISDRRKTACKCSVIYIIYNKTAWLYLWKAFTNQHNTQVSWGSMGVPECPRTPNIRTYFNWGWDRVYTLGYTWDGYTLGQGYTLGTRWDTAQGYTMGQGYTLGQRYMLGTRWDRGTLHTICTVTQTVLHNLSAKKSFRSRSSFKGIFRLTINKVAHSQKTLTRPTR